MSLAGADVEIVEETSWVPQGWDDHCELEHKIAYSNGYVEELKNCTHQVVARVYSCVYYTGRKACEAGVKTWEEGILEGEFFDIECGGCGKNVADCLRVDRL